MHTIQLIIEHSTGRRTRKKKKLTVDDFPECEAVRKVAKEGASYMINKKAKGIWKKYAAQMKELKRHQVKLIVPNDTRAAGVVLMYQSLIQSRFNLMKFYSDHPGSMVISNNAFVNIAELEAVLYALSVLIKLIQTDMFGSIAYSFVLCFRTYVHYAIQRFWYVADVCSVSAERENHWHAGAKMPQRNWRGIPNEYELHG